MTKKKNMIARICGLLIVLTLISCCFLGSTFARYTSSVSGTGSVSVAKWDIDVTGAGNAGSLDVSFSDLSPLAAAYSGDERAKSTERTLVATLTNRGEVSASVSLDYGTTVAEGVEVQHGTGPTDAAEDYTTDNNSYGDDAVLALFTITFYTNTEDNAEGATAYKNPVPVAPDGSLYVYAVVTWTTDDSASASDGGAAADLKDTYVGEWIESISWPLTYTAVQASERP